MMLALAVLLGPGCAHRSVAPVEVVEAVAPPATLDAAARAVLETGAADADVAVRRAALAALVAVDPAPAGGAWALRGRYDPSEYVRRAAMTALGARLGEPESRALLRAVVMDGSAEPWTRGAAALAVVHGARSGAVPAAEVPADRAAVVAAAGEVRGGRAAALLLAAASLGDTAAAGRLREIVAAGNLPLELWLVEAIGALPEAGLAPALVGALDAGEPELRLAVAAALLALGDPAGEGALVAALGGDEEVALEALDYLVHAPGPGARAVLAGATPASPLVREVVGLLRFAHGEGAARAVTDALASADPELRLFAARAAARRFADGPPPEGADRLRAVLRDALDAADPAEQLVRVAALGVGATPADRVALRGLLADESARLRVEAAAALARGAGAAGG